MIIVSCGIIKYNNKYLITQKVKIKKNFLLIGNSQWKNAIMMKILKIV